VIQRTSHASPATSVRVEYLGFQNVGEEREFRFRVHRADAWSEYRLRVAIAAFATTRLQDGPDICYQRLVQFLASGEPAPTEAIAVLDSDLTAYRDAHRKIVKHRRGWVPSPPNPTAAPAARPRYEPRPAAPMPAPRPEEAPPRFAEGQRVTHAIFGPGVTVSSSGDHTLVRFDEHGTKKFVTTMLQAEVLSGPGTWETPRRGSNRPVKVSRDRTPR
jgi:hypothetical protein